MIDKKGNEKQVFVAKTRLHITVNGKKAEEMESIYQFTARQRQDLVEILSEEYAGLWNSLLAGSGGSSSIVEVALSQLGNVGGQPYWTFMGYNERVSWCACFVSWCANECSYIDSGIIPSFSACQSQGIPWFQASGLWQERDFVPNPRRYYIF